MRIITHFRKKHGIYLSIIWAFIVITILALLSYYNYLLFHSFAELFSIIIAFAIFIVVWNSRRFIDNNYFLFLGIIYLLIGFLDILHTLAYTGMGVFMGYSSNLATQFWIFARYIESISLFAATFFVFKKIKSNLVFLVYSIIILIFMLSVFYWKIFPTSYIEGQGLTQFKIISEYIIIAILAATVLLLLRKRKAFGKNLFMLILASIIIKILSELSFTFYQGVFDIQNQIGHHLKILSFFLLYKAVVETSIISPFETLFSNVSSIARFPSEDPNPVFRVDNRYKIIYSNKAAKDLFKKIDIVHEKIPEKLINKINSYLERKGKKGLKVELKIDKSVYEFSVIKVSDTNYFNIYVREITEIKRMNKILIDRERQKATLKERQHLADELHDTASQTIFASNILSESVLRSLEKNPKKTLSNIKKIKELNRIALLEMRALLYELKPEKVFQEKLKDLIKRLAEIINKKYQIKVSMKFSGDHEFSFRIKHQIYRIAQEAINNILKHSEATRIKIILESDSKDMRFVISDNGKGFNISDKVFKKSFGLSIMKERAQQIKAKFDIKSSPGKGTVLTLIKQSKE